MSPSYRTTLNHTVQLTQEWVNQIDSEVGWNDPDRSYHLMRATLRALRDMLPVDEAAQLGAQLPLLIKGLYYEGWNPSATPVKDRDRADFVSRISREFGTDPLAEPEAAICAVFSVLNSRVSAGEIEDVRGALRKHLRELWPSPTSV